MKTNQYKVIITDDHVLLRDALAGLIDSFDEFRVIGVAENGQHLKGVLDDMGQPDIVILDINMPVMDGFQTAKWLNENYPGIKILILTMFDAEIALIRLLRLGVKGFLKKDIHPSELRNALLAVAGDGFYYSQNTTGKLATFFQKTLTDKNAFEKGIINETEIEFLKLASTDKTYKEIASDMKITPRAIDGFRDSLFDKLNVKSRVGLAIYAVKNGIVRL